PTIDEVEDFVKQWNEPKNSVPSTQYSVLSRLVDKLLASPHYGERWGRHWLDVARYADTKDGVLMFGADRVRPYAYTYRDYVIRALNDDTPFDRFVHEQLAADQIEPKVEPWRQAAMGYLTLGRMFDNNIHEVLDDRIDTAPSITSSASPRRSPTRSRRRSSSCRSPRKTCGRRSSTAGAATWPARSAPTTRCSRRGRSS